MKETSIAVANGPAADRERTIRHDLTLQYSRITHLAKYLLLIHILQNQMMPLQHLTDISQHRSDNKTIVIVRPIFRTVTVHAVPLVPPVSEKSTDSVHQSCRIAGPRGFQEEGFDCGSEKQPVILVGSNLPAAFELR